MEVKDLIKKKRKDLGYTQVELGKLVGVSGPTIARYESGNIENMGRGVISKLSQVLGIPASQLMGWDDTKINKSVSSADSFRGLKDAIDTLIISTNIKSVSDIDQVGMIHLMEVARAAIALYIDEAVNSIDK
ncbi:MAG: helix-turn-helix transcriptional regulator [Clostridiaceae bacterium]